MARMNDCFGKTMLECYGCAHMAMPALPPSPLSYASALNGYIISDYFSSQLMVLIEYNHECILLMILWNANGFLIFCLLLPRSHSASNYNSRRRQSVRAHACCQLIEVSQRMGDFYVEHLYSYYMGYAHNYASAVEHFCLDQMCTLTQMHTLC